MRTAEARLAPVSEVREMKMDMWRSLEKTGTSTVDKSILCEYRVFLVAIEGPSV